MVVWSLHKIVGYHHAHSCAVLALSTRHVCMRLSLTRELRVSILCCPPNDNNCDEDEDDCDKDEGESCDELGKNNMVNR